MNEAAKAALFMFWIERTEYIFSILNLFLADATNGHAGGKNSIADIQLPPDQSLTLGG